MKGGTDRLDWRPMITHPQRVIVGVLTPMNPTLTPKNCYNLACEESSIRRTKML